MKPISSILIVLCVLMGLNGRLSADDAKAAAAPWYKLKAQEVYHSDFALKPGESKALQIASAVPVIIGFRTDISFAQAQQYNHPDVSPMQISTADGEVLGASAGAARRFKPEKGTVALTAKNNADFPLRIVIYTTAPVAPK